MSEIQVYLDPCTINSRKVLAGLDLMKCPYKLNHIDFFKGEQKSESFTKINPHQTVPAATDGDLTLTESNAILMYAADRGSDDSVYPKDLKLRADANRWLLWEASVWFGTNYVYVVENVVKPLMGAEPDQSILEKEAPKWNKAAGILDTRLGETGKWILPGDKPTIVDMAVASAVHLHEAQKIPLDQHTNLKRWIADVEELPEWKNTQGAVDKALLPNKKGGEVRAEFNYTKDLEDKLTEIYFYEDPKAVGIHEPGDDLKTMSVKSGWGQEWDVDKNGFTLKDWSPEYRGSWEDNKQVEENFYPEVVEFLKKELGAKRVLVFDHTIRTKKNQQKALTDQTNTSQRAPVRLVHCDYTSESAPLRVKQLLPDEASNLLTRRVAFVNVWKPLNKVEENPLAMCDVKSTPPEDFFKLYLRYKDRTGENYVMRHSDRHQWYYFPDMTKDQSILLKTYDSDTNRAQFVGHTAFDDPTSPKDAIARESCEIRTICFF
ncbi:Putative glutathione S-transferase, Thioredoxin-like superfamily, glutathione Transferase family [Septoria linicola]|uniref:Glutathione S-transferase, Thioredoxin-like superfamily, glutathione Transferase family n=1 Tax=Septoria linicola TaxID=215465 RepID=A0A9Q9AQD7_9PEZI|nr:Putative glutathione S-transferase, Thioredoxin-like superfamily, glutathione Transferase family [Septoria linicola]